MALISATDIANYAPHGNAVLRFSLPKAWQVDPVTGNVVSPIKNQEELQYLAAINLTKPNWQGKEGVDNTAYMCTGRLLTPVEFDERITNGSQAQATINGYDGRFELVWDLTADKNHRQDTRTKVEGTFRVIGGKD